MDKADFQPCPQCHHHNELHAKTCELCEWSLSINSDETQLPPVSSSSISDKTIDPNATTQEYVDPNLTVAPAVLAAEKAQDKQQKTFQLAGDLAHFEVIKVLGQGGMGMVYHAKDRILGRDVALKMLRPVAANNINTEALLDEARMASKLNHPNIVTIYDVARADNSNYIVMEWVDGQSLDELIPDDGMPLETAIRYASQIAEGLSSAHQKYIIHRDIKPQNIMLSEQSTVKILDFGIAGLVEQLSDSEAALSTSNNPNNKTTPSAGTPSYMSPEQAQGLNLDQRSDIFSFGLVLYQMLTGKRAFVGDNSVRVKQAICEGDYTPLNVHKPELPQQVVQLVDQMLATAKDERWQSSAELAVALKDIHQELTHTKNWWQKQHWAIRVAILLPFILGLGWSVKDILFPATTQQLIERQLAEANKIAILPFENISGDPLIQIFADGLAVNLGTDLTAIAQEQGNTWIVPATEISRMKEVTPKTVADKYGVDLILTGSMQHMGSTRLMVLNLIDAKSGQQLKTVEININADNLFAGHAKIRSQAMNLLDWPMTEELSRTFNAERPQLDGAYKEYLSGRGFLYRYDHEGNLLQAIYSFKSAIDLDPYFENAYIGLAETYLNQFTKSKEKDWLSKMISVIDELKIINKNNSFIDYLTAEAELKLGNYEQAVKMYQQSINRTPKNIDAQIGLATALNKISKTAEAEQIYLNAIQEAPNNWNVIVNLGVFYAQTGNYPKALAQFQKLIDISPNNHIGYRNIAGIYYILNDIENAVAYSKKAIAIKPSDRAYSNLGTMLFSAGKYSDAIIQYKNAIELNSEYYLYWGNLADAYKLAGEEDSIDSYHNAVIGARKLLEIDPNDTAVMADLSYYLANVNQKNEAINFANNIGEQNSGSDNFIIATAYDELGMVEAAMQHLIWALNKNYPIEEILSTPLLSNSKETKEFQLLINSNLN